MHSSAHARDLSLLGALALGVALMCTVLLGQAPRAHAAAAYTLTALTATTSPVYPNAGFATTSRATTGDAVNFLIRISGTPWSGGTPTINILGIGTTTFTGGAGTNWTLSTTTASYWTEGLLTYYIAFGNSDGTATTTISQTSVTAPNVYFDKTAPSLLSASWSDGDNSTQFSGGDTIAFTFSETMATSTITTGNINTTLGLTNSHTFGTTANGLALGWNVAGTVLTVTLGSDTTITGLDTVNPSVAVKDAIGIIDATVSNVTLPDTTGPGSVTGISDSTFTTTASITLSSAGATSILYTTDGSTPTCLVGTTFSTAFTLTNSTVIKAIGCDQAGNASGVTTATYAFTPPTGSSSGGSHSTAWSAPAATAHASGLSSVQVSSIIKLLQSFGADSSVIANVQTSLMGSANTPMTGSFSHDLTMGATGADVKLLQQYLNTHGYQVMATGAGSPGAETMLFGGATKAALAKLQVAAGITPAAGYLGPKTRAYISAHP